MRPFLDFLKEYPDRTTSLSRKILNWSEAEATDELYRARRREILNFLLQLDFLREYALSAVDMSAWARTLFRGLGLKGRSIVSSGGIGDESADFRLQLYRRGTYLGISLDPYVVLRNVTVKGREATGDMYFYRSGLKGADA
jgi:hypothetical protein